MGMYDGMDIVPQAAGPVPAAPKAPPGMYDGMALGVEEWYKTQNAFIRTSGSFTTATPLVNGGVQTTADSTCQLHPKDLLWWAQEELLVALGTTMYIAVCRLEQPVRLRNGQMCATAWFGHVAGSFATGHRNAGEIVAVCSDSGIEFENQGIRAEAAHVHCCGDPGGNLTPNGSLDGALVWEALVGPVTDEMWAPGPDEYLTRQYFRGRPVGQCG